MPWTIDSALDDDDITVVERDDRFGSYSFRVGQLSTVVNVELRRALAGEETMYYRSHAIHTPVQAGPYTQSRPYWDDPAYALHQAVHSLTSYYRQAVKEGHTPAESWLVPTGDDVWL